MSIKVQRDLFRRQWHVCVDDDDMERAGEIATERNAAALAFRAAYAQHDPSIRMAEYRAMVRRNYLRRFPFLRMLKA